MTNPQSEGILLVDKEKERSAFYLIKVLRKLSGIKKIGHAGTLDPFATGVMVMLIGRPYTKIADRFLQDDKEYIATLQLGAATDTYDCDGTITNESSYIPSKDEIDTTIQEFQGTIEQIPPMFSAKKIQGQRLYKLARKGLEVKRHPIQVKLDIALLTYTYPHLTIRVACSKGTYIRTLAHDIGLRLKCYAHLTALQRTRSGTFSLQDCIDAKDLADPSFSYIPYLRKSL